MLRRLAATGCAAILAALALGACGGDSGSEATAAASPRERAETGALKFARCMREQGLDFPDPQVGANGQIRIGPGQGARQRFRPNDPKFRAAMQKCRKHLRFGGGERPSPAQQAQSRDAFLKFARCMRANGVNIPDPTPGRGPGFMLRRGARGAINPDSPKFRAAATKCRPLLAEIERGPGVPR